MKYMLRLLQLAVVAFLLLLTVCTAAYRLDPAVSPELEAASGQSLSERISGALNDAVSDIQNVVSDAGSSLMSAAADTVLGAVADVERTGEYSANGSEILKVEVPAGTLSTVSSAVSGELGGMVTTADLVTGLNTVEGVNARQNEDGTVSLTVPEDIYEQYKDQIAGYLGN